MDTKKWIIFSVIVAGILALLVFLSGQSKLDVSGIDQNQVLEASEQSGNIADNVFGKADSSVILIEYGDFQCPGCAAAHPAVEELVKEYEDKIAFVFRNYPLTSAHPNAKAAAGAAEAAGLQGKYWDMFDKVFTLQNDWNNLSGVDRTDRFVSYAQELGLDIEKFKSDMASESVNKKINFDQALGKKSNVSATPSFFLNGELLDEEVSRPILQQGDTTALKALIDSKL